MIRLLYRIYLLTTPKLGSVNFFPIPQWLKVFLRRYNVQKQVAVYAKLLVGVDMSFLTPNELGCAESVTRLLRNIDTTLTPVITGTYTLLGHLERSRRFIEIGERHVNDGCVAISATGTGFVGKIGHVGIVVGKRIYSNNSYTGKWDAHWSMLRFKDDYQRKGGMKVRYFAII